MASDSVCQNKSVDRKSQRLDTSVYRNVFGVPKVFSVVNPDSPDFDIPKIFGMLMHFIVVNSVFS